MSRFTQRLLAAALCMGLGMSLAACARPAAETPAPAPVAFSVTGVELGRAIGGDKRISDKTDTFKPVDMIFASVLTTGASPGATLKARWTYQDGQVVDETEQAIAPTGDSATEFHISKADGWPTGKYKLEVLLDGTTVQTREFEVK